MTLPKCGPLPQSSHFSAIVFPTRLSVAAGNFALRSCNTEPFILTDALSTAKPGFGCIVCHRKIRKARMSNLSKVKYPTAKIECQIHPGRGAASIPFIFGHRFRALEIVRESWGRTFPRQHPPILGYLEGGGPPWPAEPFTIWQNPPLTAPGQQPMTLLAKRFVRFMHPIIVVDLSVSVVYGSSTCP
jgi:hypothetical protein